MAFLVRVLINGVAIWLATLILPGLEIVGGDGGWQNVWIILLIALSAKNAILIVEVALELHVRDRKPLLESAVEAARARFRPILMTTLAAALGALPLAIGFGEGSELRQPLGIAIIGGLIASQLLTLLTTPVVYVLMDKLRRRTPEERELTRHPLEEEEAVPSPSK